MRMYPVPGRGEARLRAKTVFICVYHGWEYHWRLVRQCGGRHGQANCPWHTRTEASVRAVTHMQIALEAGRRLGDHKDRPYPDTPKSNLLYVSLGNW
jgi:hypothetical protein